MSALGPPIPADCACPPPLTGGCTLCGDDAFPATVLEVDSTARTATIEVEGRPSSIAIDLLDAVRPGDVILVQFGFALCRAGGV